MGVRGVAHRGHQHPQVWPVRLDLAQLHLYAHKQPLEAPEGLCQGDQEDDDVMVAQVGRQLVRPAQAQRQVGGHEVQVEGAAVQQLPAQHGGRHQPPLLRRAGAHLAEPGDLPVALHIPVVGIGRIEQRCGQPQRLPEAAPLGGVHMVLDCRQQDDREGGGVLDGVEQLRAGAGVQVDADALHQAPGVGRRQAQRDDERAVGARLEVRLHDRPDHEVAHSALRVAQRLGQRGQHIGQQKVGPGDRPQGRGHAPQRLPEEQPRVAEEQRTREEQQAEQRTVQQRRVEGRQLVLAVRHQVAEGQPAGQH